MKKLALLSFVDLTALSLSACGTSSHKSSATSHSSSKVVKHHKKKHSKMNRNSSSFTSSNSSSQNTQQSNHQNSTQPSQQSKGNAVNSANDAVAAAKAKYGNDGGRIHWNYMIDADTGQPIRNADGSYFVKGTADDGTMTGTQYSLNINSDGSMTSN